MSCKVLWAERLPRSYANVCRVTDGVYLAVQQCCNYVVGDGEYYCDISVYQVRKYAQYTFERGSYGYTFGQSEDKVYFYRGTTLLGEFDSPTSGHYWMTLSILQINDDQTDILLWCIDYIIKVAIVW